MGPSSDMDLKIELVQPDQNQLLATAVAMVMDQLTSRMIHETVRTEVAAAMATPPPISAAEAAKRLRRRPATILAALHSGRLPGTYDPTGYGSKGSWRIDPRDVDRYAREG